MNFNQSSISFQRRDGPRVGLAVEVAPVVRVDAGAGVGDVALRCRPQHRRRPRAGLLLRRLRRGGRGLSRGRLGERRVRGWWFAHCVAI